MPSYSQTKKQNKTKKKKKTDFTDFNWKYADFQIFAQKS